MESAGRLGFNAGSVDRHGWLKLAVEFNPAADAKLDQGLCSRQSSRVLRGTMVWIVVKEWSSAEEVTLDFGLVGRSLWTLRVKRLPVLKKMGDVED